MPSATTPRSPPRWRCRIPALGRRQLPLERAQRGGIVGELRVQQDDSSNGRSARSTLPPELAGRRAGYRPGCRPERLARLDPVDATGCRRPSDHQVARLPDFSVNRLRCAGRFPTRGRGTQAAAPRSASRCRPVRAVIRLLDEAAERSMEMRRCAVDFATPSSPPHRSPGACRPASASAAAEDMVNGLHRVKRGAWFSMAEL